MGKGRVHELHLRNLVGCMDLKIWWPPRQKRRVEGTYCPFMVESVAVLLRGGLSMGTLCSKFGVLELNN